MAVSAALSGLMPGTTYHYRLVASNADGSSASADRTFTTTATTTTTTATTTTTPPLPGVSSVGGTSTSLTTRPRILSASLRPRAFAVRARPGRTVATLSYRLSEAARVVITVERVLTGRRSGHGCHAQTRANRGRPRCTRYLRTGQLTARARAGVNRKSLSGRFGRHALKSGAYRLTLVATDAAGHRSAPRRLRFRVIRRQATTG